MQDWLSVEQSLLEQERAQSARYAAEVTNQMYADGMVSHTEYFISTLLTS